MNSQPPFSGICTFFGAPSLDESNQHDVDVCIAGIPFDLGTTNRPGARFGPRAIRESSQLYINDFHPDIKVCPTDCLKIIDAGDLRIIPGYLEDSVRLIEEQSEFLISKIGRSMIGVGGDHTVTLPLLRALNKKLKKPVSLIHFDAHVDTWKNSFGAAIGHGSPFYYASEENLIEPSKSIQIGIRSPIDPKTWNYTKELGFNIITSEMVHISNNPSAIANEIIKTVGNNLVYLTFDIDSIEPSQAPGTGTPEPGGLFTWQVFSILRRLKQLNFVGMDLVEVAPAYDHCDLTSHLGANIIWTYLSLVANKKNSFHPNYQDIILAE